MVQIIQSGPSTATLRQQALDQALQGAIQSYGVYDKQKKDEALTLRQQALQDQQVNLKLAEMGIDASAKDLMDYSNGTYKPKEISPGQEAIPAQYGKELQGPVMPGQDPLREVFSRGKEAVPAVVGNANPMLNYTEAKKAKIAADALKESQEGKIIQSKIDAIPLEHQSKIADLENKKFELENKKELSPFTKRKLMGDIDGQILAQKKLMGEIANLPLQRDKLIADTQKAQRENLPQANTIPGYENLTGQKPSEKDAEGLKKLSKTTTNILNAAEALKSSIRKHGVSSGFGTTEGGRAVDQDLTNLQIELKNLYELGALSGPDMGLVNNAIGKISGPMAYLTPGNDKASAVEQVQRIVEKAIQNQQSEASARGFKPIDTQTTSPKNPVAAHPQASEAMKWAQANPDDPRAREIMARVQ